MLIRAVASLQGVMCMGTWIRKAGVSTKRGHLAGPAEQYDWVKCRLL